MITEFLSVYSHFCSKILRIWQKFAVEYCSYKGLTLKHHSIIAPIKTIVEYCSYKGLTLCHRLYLLAYRTSLNIVLIKD